MSEIPYMMANTQAEFERVRDLTWPATPAPAVTDRTGATDAEFQARIAAFEGANAAPESFDPIAAVRRVEALAEKWDADAKRNDDAEPVSSDGLTRMILGARFLRMNAADLRAAIAAPQTGEHTTDEEAAK